MVERQIVRRGVTDQRLLAALRTVPRENFVPKDMRGSAYRDGPLPIGEGQTISQPYIVAVMIEAAAIGPCDRVLEVGAGSGYAAAVLSRMAARVLAVERHGILARKARRRIAALGYANCQVIEGDAMTGLSAHAPFDAILVAARSESVPGALKRQLTIGGRLVMPVGAEDVQRLLCVTRTGPDEWTERDVMAVRFVPLLPGTVPGEDKPHQALTE